MNDTTDIAQNRQTLIGIVAALFAMLGGGRVWREVRVEVLRVLRPAEAAVRRLIVIAAQGLVLKPAIARPMPAGLSRTLWLMKKDREARPMFSLCDPAVAMVAPVHRKYVKLGPRITVVEPRDPTITALFAARTPAPVPIIAANDDLAAIARRLAAIRMALDDLPRQARRLVRWRARRGRIAALRPIATSPLRPGRAPYLPVTPFRDIDFVLERCHLLARDVLYADTS